MRPHYPAEQPPAKAGQQFRDRLKRLNAHVTALKMQARELRGRAARLSPSGRSKRHAVVERSRCSGCGLCEQFCPARAIRVTYIAHVDAERCTACGACVQNCPQGAMRLATAATTPAAETENA